MKGRVLTLLAAAVLAAALAGQTLRWRAHLGASRRVRQVEQLASAAAVRGKGSLAMLASALQALHEAERLDPLLVRVPLTRGGLHLLFHNYAAAEEAFREAERIEPRPEAYLGLGHAYARQGRTADAARYYDLARRLDSSLAPSIPPEY